MIDRDVHKWCHVIFNMVCSIHITHYCRAEMFAQQHKCFAQSSWIKTYWRVSPTYAFSAYIALVIECTHTALLTSLSSWLSISCLGLYSTWFSLYSSDGEWCIYMWLTFENIRHPISIFRAVFFCVCGENILWFW